MAAFSSVGLSMLLQGVGVGTSAIGQWQAGNAAARAGKKARKAKEREAALVDWNAQVADLQAQDAIARGAEEESRYRSQVRGLIGANRAATAGGGIDVGSGTALDQQADLAFLGELDALTIRTNAAREAWGYSVEAEDLRQRATTLRAEGSELEAIGAEQRRSSRFAAASTIVGGLSDLSYLRGERQARTGAGRQTTTSTGDRLVVRRRRRGLF